jgi:hypothetical protein
MMTSQPGSDMGNVVAWRDFKKPAGIPDEQFSIPKDNSQYYRVSTSKCTEPEYVLCTLSLSWLPRVLIPGVTFFVYIKLV